MSVTRRYRDAWEGFWGEVSGAPGEVIWDAEPGLAAGLHLALYEPYVEEPGLPLVDLGCGNGTQTRFLAGRFPEVLGVDLSAAAIALAERREQRRGASEGVRFRRLDVVDGGAVAALHGELGDCNVYMRGVLHQTDPQDRQVLADSVATLIGGRGRAFVVELTEAAGRRLGELARSPAGPPPRLRPVLRHGIVPGAVADAEVPGFFAEAGLGVLAAGELPLTTTEYEPDGSRIRLPSRWWILGREERAACAHQ